MNSARTRVLKIVTVPITFETILTGQMRFLNENGYDVTMVSANSAGIGALTTREGCPHQVVNFRRQISIWYDFLALVETLKLIRQLRPDVVHTQTPKAGFIGMLAAWLLGVPVRLHTVGGLPLLEKTGLMRWFLIQIERITYALTTRVFVNSFGLKQYIERHIGGFNTKLFIIGNGSTNGVDVAHFKRSAALESQARALRTQWSYAHADFVWIYVGRITRDKGIDELIAAFVALVVRQPNAKLLVLGGFDAESDSISPLTKHAIINHQAIKHIDFQADVRPYLIAANAFVFPSYREGLPNALMEAACLEMPIVATNVMGCNEVITNNENGLLVPPKDAVLLADAMHRVQTGPLLRQQLSQRVRLSVCTRYERGPLLDAILAAYQNAMNHKM